MILSSVSFENLMQRVSGYVAMINNKRCLTLHKCSFTFKVCLSLRNFDQQRLYAIAILKNTPVIYNRLFLRKYFVRTKDIRGILIFLQGVNRERK